MLLNDTTTANRLQPHEIDVVLYHHPCSDGTGSAYLYWKYSKQFPDKEVKYYPMSYGYDPPQNLEGKNVLICDFSFKKNVLMELIKKVNNLLIIDHHKSAQIDLQDIDDRYKIFDMNKSGAMLTWEYLFPSISPPLMIQYIQDRDIWTNKLPNTEEFAAWFYTLPLQFEEYDKYSDDRLLLQMIETKGKIFTELNNYYISQALEHVAIKFIKYKEQYYFIAQVNYSILKSDVGNAAILKYPLADFSNVYSVSDKSNSTSFSLRSTNKNIDVSELAFSLGGGGHRNASGITINKVTNMFINSDQGCEISNSMYLYKQLQTIECSHVFLNDNQIQMNAVSIYSDVHKTELGKYLLQTRYITKEQNKIQICNDILMKQKKNCDNETHIAFVISYDEKNDVTKFTIICKSNDIKNILTKYTNYEDDKEIALAGKLLSVPASLFEKIDFKI